MRIRTIFVLTTLCFLLPAVSYSDDVYLKSGFVLRNVQVVDTTDGLVNIRRDKQIIVIHKDNILRIELSKIRLQEKSSYEMFSRDLYDEFLKSQPERDKFEAERRKQVIASRMAARADSLQRMEEYFAATYSWRRSVYIAGGLGIPQGARFELGYNFGESVALALSFGIGDNWSRDPAEGTLALLAALRFPIRSSAITPYLLLCTGGTFSVFGGSDTYTLIYVGAMVELRSGIHLRPELGLALISKHISGGTSVFGGTSPEVTEDKTRLGANVTIEIDLAHVF